MNPNPYLPGTPDEFIKANMGLAQSIAWKFFRGSKNRDIEEITSVAYVGLVKAYEGFDPTGHDGIDGGQIKFSSYAARTINGFIMTFLRAVDRPIHLGRKHIDLISKINSAGLTGYETLEEIAAKAGISIDEANEAVMASIAVNVDSMDRELGSDDGSATLGDMLGKCDESSEDQEVVSDFVAQLPARLQEIYQLRMVEEKSQLEAAKVMGVSQSYLCRLETKLMEAARQYGQRKEGDEMRAKYPEKLKDRVKELCSNGTAGDIYKLLKAEFPEIDIPYGTVATMISQFRKTEVNERRSIELNGQVNSEVSIRKINPEEAKKYGLKTSLDDVEWFEDISAPTMPSIGITTVGLTLNAAAVQEMHLKVGETIRIGLSPDGRFFIGKHTQGLMLRKSSSGALIASKTLVGWLKQKGIIFQRYPVRLDEQTQMHYAKVVGE